MTRLVALVAIALSVGTAASSATASPPSLSNLARQQCPHVVSLPARDQLDRILAALPGLVVRQLGVGENANGTSYRDWSVIAAIALRPGGPSATPGAKQWWSRAARRCGVRAANGSWLVVLQFPRMHFINSMGIFLLARTDHGWRLWASA